MLPMNQNLESQFNIAFEYLKRINGLFYYCQRAALSKDVDKWADYLRALYREGSIRMSNEELDGFIGKNYTVEESKIINFEITEKDYNFKLVYYMLNNPTIKAKYKHVLMYILDGLEVKLRLVMQAKGMLLPSKRDPTKAIMEM